MRSNRSFLSQTVDAVDVLCPAIHLQLLRIPQTLLFAAAGVHELSATSRSMAVPSAGDKSARSPDAELSVDIIASGVHRQIATL
jgi:hypothetical protein